MAHPAFRLLVSPAGLRAGTEHLLGVAENGVILFSAACAPAVTAATLSPWLFDEAGADLGGVAIRLLGVATFQDSACEGSVVIRSRFRMA
ncbi:MAG: hypothetical protein JOY84_12780 [Curvibacter sp.]|nr:hypothetical protein [Curvibacter sp.]